MVQIHLNASDYSLKFHVSKLPKLPYTIASLSTPKGLMAFLEFWSGSYGMSLEPNFFIFLGLILFFDIYPGTSIFFQNYL